MPIIRINSDNFDQRCVHCGKVTRHSVSDMFAGPAREFSEDPNIIHLPACACGALEFLNRTFDNPGDHAHMVNSLHAHLVKRGQVRPHLAQSIAAETTLPENRADLGQDDLVPTAPPAPFDAKAHLDRFLYGEA